ncbi:hypothetical protein [Acinetobacter sp.]|uniref:hypothetical protein n=1 Tax=Acinetobacter sp. TaxID=472 RepID=UPI00388E42A4
MVEKDKRISLGRAIVLTALVCFVTFGLFAISYWAFHANPQEFIIPEQAPITALKPREIPSLESHPRLASYEAKQAAAQERSAVRSAERRARVVQQLQIN